ncbi:MAG: hypothetical protein JWP83_5363 [Mycobacterium sp.]|nr:hypothetical protein [Mycobacterium sp.]
MSAHGQFQLSIDNPVRRSDIQRRQLEPRMHHLGSRPLCAGQLPRRLVLLVPSASSGLVRSMPVEQLTGLSGTAGNPTPTQCG